MSINDTAGTVHPLVAAAMRLSDDLLVARVEALARCSRATTVELLAHLGELERRKLHRGRGCGKLFPYCTEVLGFSEASAWNRMKAARAARRFPIVLDLLAAGRVNLTTIRLLAPHLTPENHRALLDEASGLPRRAVDTIVARLDPKPDVPSVIRKLPDRGPFDQDARARSTPSSPVAADSGASDGGDPGVVPNPGAPQAPCSVPRAAGSESAASSPAQRGVIAPLRPSRYKLEVTLGEKEHDDLRWLQDTMRREIPDGDPAAIVRHALKALRAQVEKKAFAGTDRPKSGLPVGAGSVRRSSRHVPADVKRRVWQRDQGRCAFVSSDGRRCSETSCLEYHHVEPYGIGGAATAANIALRCRAHNAYEAELVFGERAVRRSPPRGQGEGGGVGDSHGEGGAARASL